jgi:hypothetical protein
MKALHVVVEVEEEVVVVAVVAVVRMDKDMD